MASRRQMVVPAFVAGTIAVGCLGAYLAGRLPVPDAARIHLPWWGLAALFTVTQASVLNIQLRRETRSVFLSEVPLLLGLLYVSPAGLFTARILGALVASAVFRRQFRSPAKLLFNSAVAAAEAGTSLACYRLLLWGGNPMAPRAWLAAVTGAAVACVVGAVAVSLLIRALEGMQRLTDIARVAGKAGVQAAVIATVTVLVAAALDESRWIVVPLLVMVGALVAAHRGYASLNERHANLELLHGFTQTVSGEIDLEEAIRDLLVGVAELLHAEQARLTLLGPRLAGDEVLHRQGEATTSRRPSPYGNADAEWLRQRVFDSGQAVLAGRATRDADIRRWLDGLGIKDSIVVPLRTEAGIFGVLAVDDRLGEVRGFDSGDARFLETVANHVSVTLHNGRLMEQLRYDALHDSLTGLPNRSFFERELDEALHQPGGAGCTVGILDLDAFKDVNDTLGHHHGDELLREVATRLTEAAGDNALIARLGGDEFAVLARDRGGARRALQLAKTLVASLSEPLTIADVEVPLGASIGLALAPEHGSTAAILLQRADMAMYAAKDLSAGVRVFGPELDSSADIRLALVSRLRRAIERGTLEVYMQPKADLRTGAIHSAEALLRWRDERGTQVSPEEFIPVAERSGLIRPLTELVLRRAVAACAEWQRQAPGVGVAVNLSARSLTDTDLVRLVEQVLTGFALPPRLLTLELTESSVMANTTGAFRVLEQLRALGVQLSVDDFGTGYSSLSYLRRLPVTEVKVDRSFVMRMAIDSEDAAIVKSIIDLARNLRLQVVAEGIEDRATWDLLNAQGCDIGQGYHIARPMPAQDFPAWLDGRLTTRGEGRPRFAIVAN